MQSDHIPGQFRTTHWSVLLSAKNLESPESEQAIATLCETYWYPLYAYVRCTGYAPEEAEDLTQGFFARFLERRLWESVDKNRGRFRSFLLVSIRNFLADEHDKSVAIKRGGGRPLVSLDAQQAEERYGLEPAHDIRPEKLFERRWALSLLSAVFDRLGKDYRRAGKGELFQVIQAFLTPGFDQVDFQSAIKQLQMREGTLRMAIHRLRRRYGQLLRQEVAHTVAHENEVEDEIRHLHTVLSE
jgi:DNA-directed RNA polymerase specialized sigma24 family protein